ncbi:unnamed protein product [Nippostrongylus brasiliensis]|uniref:Uncharacterized protein n=1 Tax=Nippostrongylus brasiliensis TaxID=27835 RepID=A0A0N4Y074_NIPBR|nr:unnamed protein product [Nippostrongylus brasiliensis]
MVSYAVCKGEQDESTVSFQLSPMFSDFTNRRRTPERLQRPAGHTEERWWLVVWEGSRFFGRRLSATLLRSRRHAHLAPAAG